MPPVIVIVLVATIIAVIIVLVGTAVFKNPDLPPGVSASWLLCVLLGRPFDLPDRRQAGRVVTTEVPPSRSAGVEGGDTEASGLAQPGSEA